MNQGTQIKDISESDINIRLTEGISVLVYNVSNETNSPGLYLVVSVEFSESVCCAKSLLPCGKELPNSRSILGQIRIYTLRIPTLIIHD